MDQKPLRKLSLKKKTITKLTESEAQSVNGGSWYATGVCATDFTRPVASLVCVSAACVTAGCGITIGCGSDFTRPGG